MKGICETILLLAILAILSNPTGMEFGFVLVLTVIGTTILGQLLVFAFLEIVRIIKFRDIDRKEYWDELNRD